MAYRLYIVVIDIYNEGCIIVWMIVGTKTRSSVVLGSSGYRSLVEFIDRCSIIRDECDVELRVFDWCFARRIPVAFQMAGGYGHHIEETVQAQCTTYRVALQHWQRWASLSSPK